MKENSYSILAALSKRIYLLGGIEGVMGWDQETYMPKGAEEVRSQSSELLAGIRHVERTSSTYAQTLAKLIDLESGEIKDPDLSEEQRASVREMRRDYLKQSKLPQEFVQQLALASSRALPAWADARRHNQFKTFQPHLEKIVELNRKKAEYLGYDHHPYDALINSFEPEMRTQTLTQLFERLKLPLSDLLKKIQTKPDPEAPFFEKDYDHDKQLQCGRDILMAMGLKEETSRLDESVHPMCVPIHPTDKRLTTRIYPKQVTHNLLSCLHEGGHGLYCSNLPVEHYGTPLCESASLGIDESQSRTWETLVGRSLPFWKYFFPILQSRFPENLGDVSLTEFFKALNIVEPSLIRTESDEVSYNLHVLLRFEIEKGLIEEQLKVSDIPDIWNEKMLTYLSVMPKADSEGCLQDIHWSMGTIGYFPTYTLGNLYAAQFFEVFQKDHPDWETRLESGELGILSDWQKKHIHQFGRRYLPHELCTKVTGQPLSEEPFIRYLTQKYTWLYDL